MARPSLVEFNFKFSQVRIYEDRPLGNGAYGHVCEASLDDLPCAAKLLHHVLLGRGSGTPSKPLVQFEQECQLMRKVRHPNIVQFLELVVNPQTGQHVLLMELMDDSLTKFLERSKEPLPYQMQVNISHDIALAVAHLHTNRHTHRDLSSNNVLLIGPGCKAKVTDFGVSKLIIDLTEGQTQCPGTLAYMPTEARLRGGNYSEKLDCFQIGVLMIQIITRLFPKPKEPTQKVPDNSPNGWHYEAYLSQEDCRQNHLSLVPSDHPMKQFACHCLKDKDFERPTAKQVCQFLADLKESHHYKQKQRNRENGGRSELQEKDALVQQLREAVGKTAREKEEAVQGLQIQLHQSQQLAMKKKEEAHRMEIELYHSQEAGRGRERELQANASRLEGQVRALNTQLQARHQENDEVQKLRYFLKEKNREMKEYEQKIQHLTADVQSLTQQLQAQAQSLGQQLCEKDEKIKELEQLIPTYTAQLSGPGQHTATVNHETHITITLTDSTGNPCLIPQNVTACLQYPGIPQHGKPQSTTAAVVGLSASKYAASYTAVNRGLSNLHIRINGKEVVCATISVYPDPACLSRPLKCIPADGVACPKKPHGIAFNSQRLLITTETNGHQNLVSVFNVVGQKVRSFGKQGTEPGEMVRPRGVAVDGDDNIYVTSEHKLQKFNSAFNLVKWIGGQGSKPGEFEDPSGVAIAGSELYVCDRQNNRIQVFDLDLNFLREVGTSGKEAGKLDHPWDVAVDTTGNLYVADHDNARVQVLDKNGGFIRMIAEGIGKPSGVHIICGYLYVSIFNKHRVAVYDCTSAEEVASFGEQGQEEGKFYDIYGITSCAGFVYVCDGDNNRIQVY